MDEVSISDLLSLFSGSWEGQAAQRLLCLSALTEREHELSDEDLTILREIPSDPWTEACEVSGKLGIEPERLLSLAERGLLVSDRAQPLDERMRRREDNLRRSGWHPWALAFHTGAKWADMRVLAEPPDDDRHLAQQVARDIAEAVEEVGSAPPHFAEADVDAHRLALPRSQSANSFFDLLSARKTVREFESGAALSADLFAQLLYRVWGCHGIDRVSDGLAVLKKTSPSAGALHPTEVYPLVLNVGDIPCGAYHYEVSSHSLSLRRELASSDARKLADDFAAGQYYPRNAHALFIMAARFDRSFWKYREHAKAYRTLLLDIGHLSQTFYLVCTALGLGPFFTAAINEAWIEETLGLDGAQEGVLGVCGCGVLPNRELVLSFRHQPYDPRARDSRTG